MGVELGRLHLRKTEVEGVRKQDAKEDTGASAYSLSSSQNIISAIK